MRLSQLLAAPIVGLALVLASPVAHQRILVINEQAVELSHYESFWTSLRARGYDLSFKSPIEAQGAVRDHDTAAFEHLVLFAPTTKTFPADLSPQSLYRFVERGANLLVVVSPDLSEFWRDLAREFDVDFDDRGHLAVDHFNYAVDHDDGSHSTLVVPLADAPSPFISAATRAGPPILYRGSAHATGRLPLLVNLLHASPSAFSFDPTDSEAPVDDLYLSGSAAGLVSVFQTKTNARVSFVGSLDLFSDEFGSASIKSADGSSYPRTGNAGFIADLTKWTFKESGLLKVDRVHHARGSDGSSGDLYRVRDQLVYDIDISALEKDLWQPYIANDLQLELTMLDPHLRVPLLASPAAPSAVSTRFSARFQAPDRHGVFTLKVDYRRPGWTFIDEKTVISITPPRHDEYDRFITGAVPYYGGAFSVSVATLAFIVVWLLQ